MGAICFDAVLGFSPRPGGAFAYLTVLLLWTLGPQLDRNLGQDHGTMARYKFILDSQSFPFQCTNISSIMARQWYANIMHSDFNSPVCASWLNREVRSSCPPVDLSLMLIRIFHRARRIRAICFHSPWTKSVECWNSIVGPDGRSAHKQEEEEE